MQLSQEIFNILKGANIKLKLFDPEGNKTLDPESSARFYAYDNDFLITIRDEEDGVELVVQAGASFNFNEHKDVLNSIKKAGHNAMAEYNIRKFDKNIELKDFAHDVVREENEEIRRLKELSGIFSTSVTEDEEGYVSNCCGASMDDSEVEANDGVGMCSDCKEMASAQKESEYYGEATVAEGTWSLPETPEQIEKLTNLLKNPLNAETALDELYDVFGDDELFDELEDMKTNEPDEDVRFIVIHRLEDMGIKNVTEGYKPATGSLKTSYIQLPENTKLIIKHTKSVNEEVRGSRSRNIKALFIENSAGERFRFPHKYLQGAKAMANHVSHGGTPYDAIGESIVNLCSEVAQCSQFLRHIRTNKLTNEGNENIVETIKQKLKEFKNTVKSLQTSKGYNAYQVPTTAIVEEKDKEEVDITGKFMYNTFETANMDAVLETVARIIKEKDGMTDLTKTNMNRLFDMIKNKEDFQLNIDPNDPEYPDNEDPIKYSGGQGPMAKLSAMLSYLAMSSKSDEVFNLLSQISGEMYSLSEKHIILLAKIVKYLDQNNRAPATATAKEPAENIAEAILNDLRRNIS